MNSFSVQACVMHVWHCFASHFAGVAGSIKDVKWSQVKVGQVLKVHDDEDFPADLLCLFCNLADNVCYIKTTNLDGATLRAVTRPVGPTCDDDWGVMRLRNRPASMGCRSGVATNPACVQH